MEVPAMQDSTAQPERIPLPPDLERVTLQRRDLEPEPQPTIQDVIEGIAEALSRAVELAEPARTAARCLTLSARVRAAALGHVDADELLTSLRRLTARWEP
jgi:hypothetical protein